MLKCNELSKINSCLNKAEDNEMVFVLRAKDPAAPIAILAWINERVKQKLNGLQDEKLAEAFDCMQYMVKQRLSGKFNTVKSTEAKGVCPNGLLPDGETCPRCGGKRAPSGIGGGTWVHFDKQ